jgi:hypothetical protein
MALKQIIQGGLDGVVSNNTVGEIWEEAEQRSKNGVMDEFTKTVTAFVTD